MTRAMEKTNNLLHRDFLGAHRYTSSVSELLVVPDGEGDLLEDIGYIIPLVNKGMDETEVLSNFLYYYDNATHQVSICESNVMNYLK